MHKILKPTFILIVITFVVAFSIAMVNYLTKDIINERLAQEALRQRQQVMLDATKFNDVSHYKSMMSSSKSDIINGIYAGYNGDTLIGYVFSSTPKGYAGNINVTVGILKNGQISRVVMGENRETPGLGTLVGEDSFIGQYIGKSIKQNLEIVKSKPSNDDEIQAVSGATITSKAINRAVDASVDFANMLLDNGGDI